MCLFTILEKSPFPQKILYGQKAKKITAVAYAKSKYTSDVCKF